jgi:hypothetical protein
VDAKNNDSHVHGTLKKLVKFGESMLPVVVVAGDSRCNRTFGARLDIGDIRQDSLRWMGDCRMITGDGDDVQMQVSREAPWRSERRP